MVSSGAEHDPEKHVLDPDRGWAPVFGSDHAQLSGVGNMGAMALQRRPLAVQGVLAAPEARQPLEPVIRSAACRVPGVNLPGFEKWPTN